MSSLTSCQITVTVASETLRLKAQKKVEDKFQKPAVFFMDASDQFNKSKNTVVYSNVRLFVTIYNI